jgi:transcriptional regulator with XRE-family HTH domain
MKFNRQALASSLRERRKALQLDQKDLAELSGVSLHTLINLETAKGNPTLDVTHRILDVLGLELVLQVRNTVEKG